MRNRRSKLFLLFAIIVFLISTVYYIHRNNTVIIEEYDIVPRIPKIQPDYSMLVIPPNIAPLNFQIKEPGVHYYLKIHSSQGENIEVSSKSPKIRIPINSWKRLLGENRGQKLYFDIYLKDINGNWSQFDTITNTIAEDDIDPYLVYRLMKPLYNIFKEGNVYQRNLQNYDESIVVSSGSFSGCVNCHSFLNNNPDNMVIQIRSKEYGVSMLHANNDGSVEKVDLKTRFGAPASYTAWHPSGRLIAFAFIKVRQFIHYSRVEVRDVLDLDSGLAIYDIESKTIKYNPNLSNHDILETFPTWSPDGKYLYFCTAPILWTDRESVPPENFKKVKYDLVRMSYNQESGEWGDVETVLSSDETGLSITQPRISPDGRFLLFCMSEYSCFVIHQPNSDLYLMDMTTGEYKRLDCNSELHESWHSWSSNSRWIVFNSKRPDGLFAKPHLSYINKNGKAYKALILPQKDPSYYDSLVRTFNVPELIKEPIRIKRRAFVEAIKSFDKIQADKSVTTSATPQKPASQYLQP